jgi:hypothetical protein
MKYAFYRNCLSVSIGIISFGSLFFLPSSVAIADTPKAVWYRYYDQHGIANISTSVTPAHIRYGYEALDRNMQVIKRNGNKIDFNPNKILTRIKKQSEGLKVNADDVFIKVTQGIADDMTTNELDDLNGLLCFVKW